MDITIEYFLRQPVNYNKMESQLNLKFFAMNQKLLNDENKKINQAKRHIDYKYKLNQ